MHNLKIQYISGKNQTEYIRESTLNQEGTIIKSTWFRNQNPLEDAVYVSIYRALQLAGELNIFRKDNLRKDSERAFWGKTIELKDKEILEEKGGIILYLGGKKGITTSGIITQINKI